jgi:hypothetical protein
LNIDLKKNESDANETKERLDNILKKNKELEDRISAEEKYMVEVNKLMKLSGKVITASPPNEEVSWFYMWGGRDYHMSGMGTDTPDRENVIIRHERHIERLRKMKFIPTGDIELKPKWKKDYQQLLFNFIKKEKYGN